MNTTVQYDVRSEKLRLEMQKVLARSPHASSDATPAARKTSIKTMAAVKLALDRKRRARLKAAAKGTMTKKRA